VTLLTQGSSFSLKISLPIERSSPIDANNMIAANETSIIKAYEGKIKGNINAGNTGIIPMDTPRG